MGEISFLKKKKWFECTHCCFIYHANFLLESLEVRLASTNKTLRFHAWRPWHGAMRKVGAICFSHNMLLTQYQLEEELDGRPKVFLTWILHKDWWREAAAQNSDVPSSFSRRSCRTSSWWQRNLVKLWYNDAKIRWVDFRCADGTCVHASSAQFLPLGNAGSLQRSVAIWDPKMTQSGRRVVSSMTRIFFCCAQVKLKFRGVAKYNSEFPGTSKKTTRWILVPARKASVFPHSDELWAKGLARPLVLAL